MNDAIKWSKEKYKLEVIKLPAAEMAQIPKLTKPMIDDYIKRVSAKGLPGDKIIKDAYMLRDKYEKQFKGK